MNKSVLIIGGAGYIGSVVTGHLLGAGYQVTCLDLLLYRNETCVLPFLGNSNYRFVFGDMGDQAILEQSLKNTSNVIILGGLVGDPITKKYPVESHEINDRGILGCINFLNGKNLDRVIFISTCSNYGLISESDLADENYPLNPLSLYAKSKVAAELHLLEGRGKVDYAPTILRFATAFGLSSRMRFDLTVNEFTRELALGKELLVFDEKTWRPYCHVKDFARLMQLVLEAPESDVAFEVFNAGGEINNFTKQGVLDTIAAYIPNANFKYQSNGSDPRNYRVNFKKVQQVLGFFPEYTVAKGVEELLGAINEHLFDSADINRNFHGNYEVNYFLK